MKKMLSIFISLIMIMSLVACSDTAAAEPVVTPAPAPAVTEPTPEPEPEPVVEEVVEEEPAEEEAVTEEATTEDETTTEEPVEEEPAEPTEEEIVAEVLANEEFYEDGAFCPKLYAQSIGYKWYGDYDEEVDFGIVADGVEYFIWYNGSSQTMNVLYANDERCYGMIVHDMPEEVRDETEKIKTGDIIANDSNLYIKSTISVLHRLSIGETNIRDWSFKGLTYGHSQYDCKPEYFEDGFIDSTKLTNQNLEQTYLVNYDE